MKTSAAHSRWHVRMTLGIGLLLLTGGCSRKVELPSPPHPNTPSDQRTEQGWIIGAVVRDCTTLAVFATKPEHWVALPADAVDVRELASAEPGQKYALSIRLPGDSVAIKTDLKVTGSVWSPDLYVPAVQAILGRLKLVPAAAGNPKGAMTAAELLTGLTRPLTAEIEKENQRLSAWLQDHPLDAEAHEQAALLLGTLAMRENSGLFWNPRGLCNRATAELAFARAVQPQVSECGVVAELLIGLIIDTKADCQRRIAALQTRVGSNPELGPWVTAASLRNTRDYRLLIHPQDATFLERIEQFRAMSEAINAQEAIKRMPNFDPDTAPDWSRIVLQAGYGVGSGHQFAIPSIGLEMNDAVQIFSELRMARAPAQFAAVFNPPPGDPVSADDNRSPRLLVIDAGTWAQFFQRHLLQAGNETYDFLRYKWGVPDDAMAFRVQMGPLLNVLSLYPLCLHTLGKEDGEALFPAAADLLKQHPQWVSDEAWFDVVKGVPAGFAPGGSWSEFSRAWFSPRLPLGTTYGFDQRTDEQNYLPPPTLPELQKAHDIAAIKYDVSREYANAVAVNHHPSVADFEKIMGPLLEYYVRAMWGVAQLTQNDPRQYGAIMNQAATLNPNYYETLGKYYLEHKMDAEAAAAYQAGIDHEADAVTVANNSYWLVNYYFDHGQKDRALTIAQQAAEVYSYDGLATLASLLERMNRDQEAESYFTRIAERYRDSAPLYAFYERQEHTHPDYANKLRDSVGQIFPQGIANVTLAQLSGKPANGVFVHGENQLSRQFGLKPGAIVVAIDGKRIVNMEQYSYIRSLTDSPDMDLMVYEDASYKEIRAHLADRKFNLTFTTWPPPGNPR